MFSPPAGNAAEIIGEMQSMNTLIKTALVSLTAGSLLLSVQAWSATTEITWEKPEKYTDLRPANESRVKFRERTFKALDEYFAKLAEKLPEKDKLAITVTNLDLAGQVWPSSFVFGNATGTDVRIVKRVDIPRIKFSYTLTNEAGKVVKSADVDLKDMGFLDNPRTFTQNTHLGYEKAMIKEWFNEEMASALVQN